METKQYTFKDCRTYPFSDADEFYSVLSQRTDLAKGLLELLIQEGITTLECLNPEDADEDDSDSTGIIFSVGYETGLHIICQICLIEDMEDPSDLEEAKVILMRLKEDNPSITDDTILAAIGVCIDESNSNQSIVSTITMDEAVRMPQEDEISLMFRYVIYFSNALRYNVRPEVKNFLDFMSGKEYAETMLITSMKEEIRRRNYDRSQMAFIQEFKSNKPRLLS